MTQAPQKPGGAETRRPRADNRNFMPRVGKTGGLIGLHLERVPIGHKTFDTVDVNRAVQSVSAAIGFTGVGADASADGGKRIAVFDDGQRLQKISAMDVVNIFLNVDMRRTAQNAGCDAIAVMVAQKRLKINLAVAFQRFRPGPDDHAVFCRRGCRGNKEGLRAVYYFYKCGFEITWGADTRIIAQSGDFNAVGTGGVDDGQPVGCYAVFTVNMDGNHENTSFSFILYYPKSYRMRLSLP